MAATAQRSSGRGPGARGRGVKPRFSWLSDRVLARIFLMPTMILLLAIAIFPLLWSLYLSFTKFNVNSDARTGPTWIGLTNFARHLDNPETWHRFSDTARFVIPSVLIELVLGFGLAFILNRNFKGRGLIVTTILIPMMLSPLVVALFWKYMLETDRGIVNFFVRDLLHLGTPNWLNDPATSMWSLVLVDVWQWTPFIMLISLAGLSAVPKYLYEAAEVDRASGWFRFRHITLPLVTPLLLIAILFRTMDSYKMFDQAYALTGGGANTRVLSIDLFKMAFEGFDTGKASALGYIMLIVIIALANLLIRVLNGLKAEAA